MRRLLITLFFIIVAFQLPASMALRQNLSQAKPGDYIVTAQSKAYTMLLVYSKEGDILKIEEITVPMTQMNLKGFSWKQWIQNNAPGSTSWVRYTINLQDASMKEFYSFTRGNYFQIHEADNFLSKLLTLQMEEIPPHQRKKIGPKPPFGSDNRPLWQPQMVVDGQYISGVTFTALKTCWPNDGTDLSGKIIEIYVPTDGDKYPAYFPYWLQISGMVGKAKIRIVDSGTQLQSPKPANP